MYNGILVLSQDSEVSYDFQIQLRSQHILTVKHQDVQNIEFFVENFAYADSISLAYIYGSSWIISSTNGEIVQLCEYLKDQDLVIICSSIFDVDSQNMSFLPCYYALFPGLDNPTSFLIKKIMTQEQLNPISIPNINIIDNQSNIVNYAKFRFQPVVYDPYMFDSGMHQYLTSKALQGKEGPLPQPPVATITPRFGFNFQQPENVKKTSKRAVEGIANALRKRKK